MKNSNLKLTVVCFFFNLNLFLIVYLFIIRGRRRSRARATGNATVVDSIVSRGNEMFNILSSAVQHALSRQFGKKKSFNGFF